jgi:chromosome segregation ATPase
MAELWWLPSLIVFGLAGAGAAAGIVGLRRRGARHERAELDAGRRLEVTAKGLIVRADEAVRDARREIGFAEAQFGSRVATRLRESVDRAERMLRDALLLQQRLDDAEPDTAADRRTWSTRIAEMCRAALDLLDEAERSLGAARAAERGVAQGLPALRDGVAALERRCADARVAIDRLGERFAPSALASARSDLERAHAAVTEAGAELDEAAARGSGTPIAPMLGRVADRLQQAGRHLDLAERFELRLAAAVDEARAERTALDAEVVAARHERDALSTGLDSAEPGVAAAAAGLSSAVGEASALVAAPRDERDDPLSRRDRLRAARDRLDAARAEARRAAGRLDGARSALGGAIAIAESQLDVVRGLVERGRGAVGADVRTRLAEAERQLVIARQEPDPVAALDAARRAAARATDAEALARYDGSLGGR